MQGLRFETTIADEVFGRAFLELPLEGGVEEVPEVRVWLTRVTVTIVVEFVTLGVEQGRSDIVTLSGEMRRRKEVMQRVAGGAQGKEGVEREEVCQVEEDL